MSAASSSASTAAAPTSSTKRWALAVHGGAGAISREFDPERVAYMRDLRLALDAGSAILKAGGTAQDACIASVKVLEDSPLFNAGLGSVLTSEGKHELDAGIMVGSTLKAGACAGVRTFKNPILLAQKVMENSPHVLLISDGAEAFGSTQQGLERVPNEYFTTPARLAIHHELVAQAKKLQQQHLDANAIASQGGVGPTSSPNPPFMMAPVLDHSFEGKSAASAAVSSVSASPPAAVAASSTGGTHPSLGDKKFGTVGAVAIDMSGELVTTVSTGGMSMKSYGRVGDSPIVGAGFYANRHVAVCCTGNGEAFIRCAVAKDVAALMEYGGLPLKDACARALVNGEVQCGKIDFEGGLIAIDAKGNIAMPYNSHGMYRGAVSSETEAHVAVWETNAPYGKDQK